MVVVVDVVIIDVVNMVVVDVDALDVVTRGVNEVLALLRRRRKRGERRSLS